MAEIINLRRVRKRLARDAAGQDAAAARAQHGRTRGERDGATKERDALDRTLDGAKVTPSLRDGKGPE